MPRVTWSRRSLQDVVALRGSFQTLKKAKGMGEDDQKMWSEEVQEMTDKAITAIDRALEGKQQEIMQV